MPKDKVMHIVMGVLMLIYGGIGVYLTRYGYGPAAAWFTTAGAIGVEAYQKARKEGTPDVLDAVASAAPGWLVWLGLYLKG
jgi:hypothetical protein